MSQVDIDHLRGWIGREEQMVDTISATPMIRMAATLGFERDQWQVLPPLWHWLFFLLATKAPDIAADGHAKKGGFLPPVPLPRRMWAGSRIEFVAPMHVGEQLTRTSTIRNVALKGNDENALIFVTVEHRIAAGSKVRLVEELDIVYRHPPAPGSSPTPPEPPSLEAAFSREVVPDPVLLFRFSALTFNAHRIHYDRDYATGEEGYPGLIVHGPLTATMLIQLLADERPGLEVSRLKIRAQGPIFDNESFVLKGAESGDSFTLWAENLAGGACLRIDATPV